MNTHNVPTMTEPLTSAAWTPERGWHNVTETERRAMQAETVRRLTEPRWMQWTKANQNAKEYGR
jgi:hypothetical protein